MHVELFDLKDTGEEYKWLASARWIKYEEHVEGVDNHWGRPHIPFIPFQSVFQLKQLFGTGALIFDAQISNYNDLAQTIISNLVSHCGMDLATASKTVQLLEMNKTRRGDNRFMSQKRSSSIRIRPVLSAVNMNPNASNGQQQKISVRKTSHDNFSNISSSNEDKIFKRQFSIKSIPDQNVIYEDDMEVCQIYTGEWSKLAKPVLVMVRFLYGAHVPELLEAVVKIRFIIIILGPRSADFSDRHDYHEIGRAVGILMASKKFRELALIADSKRVLIYGIDNFINEAAVLPLCDIDNKDLLNVDNVRKAMRKPRTFSNLEDENEDVQAAVKKISVPAIKIQNEKNQLALQENREFPDPFVRTRRPFGGVINDIRYRLPYYFDDLKSALSFQCVTSILFIFCANFANAVAIGEVLGEKTEDWMGVSEILISHAICGVIWGLFAGQPLCITAAVGPFLVFEESLYNFCKSSGASFLATRFWTGLWTFIMMTILAMVEAPFLMRYLTRFTEDIFTGLIALIFIWAGGKFVYQEFESHPLQNIETYCTLWEESKVVSSINASSNFSYPSLSAIAAVRFAQTYVSARNDTSIFKLFNDTADDIIEKEKKITNQPDTAILSGVFFLATFLLAFGLKKLRMSIYCGRTIRRAIGDFGVPLSMIIITFWDQVVFDDTYTRHLTMKPTFGLTEPNKRGWLVNPMGTDDDPFPVWIIPASIVPAILVTILLYAEVEIVEALLAKKDKGLKKPSGFHWDLIICGGSAFLCSILGLQWMCPAAVQSLSHMNSLTVMKKTAPGEAPQIDYVLENRVTTVIIALLHGAAAFCGIFLSLIPTSALFGLFFYLGVMGLMGIQFWYRIILFFVPEKYFPDEDYCQNVTIKKMHFYTVLQLLCFIVLWCVNIFSTTALAFPFVLMIIALFRLFVIPKIFSETELLALDGMPAASVAATKQNENKKEEEDKDFYDQISINGL